MKYCTRCLYPDMKPNLTFNAEGVCSACTAFETRKEIDWNRRKEDFQIIADGYRNKAGMARQPYDCIVPVSGGKDSHYQVLKCLEYGLRPLAVTAMTDNLTPIGWRNLNNISKLGVDHVMVQVNQQLRRRINKFALETVGDISWPEHVLIFTVPIREAILRGIPLIIYGECPENEYGGPAEAQKASQMSRRWLEEFGGLNGLRVTDIIDAGMATRDQMEQYIYPLDNPLGLLQVESLFLGQFFPWDGRENAEIAEKHGFETWNGRVDGTFVDYENLDNAQTGIHDYLKFVKFGFGRATDHACNWIRRGYMTREEGLYKVRCYDGETPDSYLGIPISKILADIDMSEDEFFTCINKFANPELFKIVKDEWPEPKFIPC